jgi:hypothetical protein
MSFGSFLSRTVSAAKGKVSEASALQSNYRNYSSQELINMIKNDDVSGTHAMAVKMLLKERASKE